MGTLSFGSSVPSGRLDIRDNYLIIQSGTAGTQQAGSPHRGAAAMKEAKEEEEEEEEPAMAGAKGGEKTGKQ